MSLEYVFAERDSGAKCGACGRSIQGEQVARDGVVDPDSVYCDSFCLRLIADSRRNGGADRKALVCALAAIGCYDEASEVARADDEIEFVKSLANGDTPTLANLAKALLAAMGASIEPNG